MSYTKPASTAVDFTFEYGYNKPATTAVNFSFFDAPVAAIVGTASASFAGVAFCTSTASIPCAATPNLVGVAFPTSIFNLAGSTSFALEHPYRDLVINTGATPSFIGQAYGAAATAIEAGSSTYFERYYPPPIQGVTTFAPFGGGIYATAFRVAGVSRISAKAMFEVPIRFFVEAKGVCGAKTNRVTSASQSSIGRTVASFSGRSMFDSAFLCQGAGAVLPSAGAALSAIFSSGSGASPTWVGSRLGAAALAVSGAGNAAFYGSHTTTTVVPYDSTSDVIFAVDKKEVIRVVC